VIAAGVRQGEAVRSGLSLPFNNNRDFCTDVSYPYRNRGWRAQRAGFGRADSVAPFFAWGIPWLARTAAVRADRRLRTDEKPIRAKSTILDKTPCRAWFFFAITAFSVPLRFSSVQKTRLARERAMTALAMFRNSRRRMYVISIHAFKADHHE
jgi:hypothetical protein